MAYHTPLTNSQEFTAALLRARELAHNITMGMRQIPGTAPDFEVFPYTYVLSFPKRIHLISHIYRTFKSKLCVVSDQYLSSVLLQG